MLLTTTFASLSELPAPRICLFIIRPLVLSVLILFFKRTFWMVILCQVIFRHSVGCLYWWQCTLLEPHGAGSSKQNYHIAQQYHPW